MKRFTILLLVLLAGLCLIAVSCDDDDGEDCSDKCRCIAEKGTSCSPPGSGTVFEALTVDEMTSVCENPATATEFPSLEPGYKLSATWACMKEIDHTQECPSWVGVFEECFPEEDDEDE